MNECVRLLLIVAIGTKAILLFVMATSPNTGQTTKQRFWSKFKVAPRPIPRRKRGTSDSAQITPSPPSLPSLPSHAHKPRKKATPTKRCEDEFPCYKFLSEEMTLPEFAQQFQNDLPQQVVVTRGVYWRENLEVNISSSERLNIHFIRHRESVSPWSYWLETTVF